MDRLSVLYLGMKPMEGDHLLAPDGPDPCGDRAAKRPIRGGGRAMGIEKFNVVIDIQRRLRWPAESAFLAHRGPDEPRQRAPRTIRHEPQQRPLGSERRKHHRGYTTIQP
ncbi:hypothetical protein HYQ46_007022 [Verticillium longisporum]|nr:hypothetical protein HYQ46_007022 [Verticillium longisporum]